MTTSPNSILESTSGYVLAALCTFSCSPAVAHDWTDSTGQFQVAGTLIAMDDKEIVLKLDKPEKGRELLAFPLDQLSEKDKNYLASEEVTKLLKDDGTKQSWSLRNGLTLFAKVVDYGRKDVTIQRRRAKVYVNDRPLDTLPEIYRRMIPRIVEHFEKVKFDDEKAFSDWVLKLKGAAKTFQCEGVLLELPNGEEYAVPFFAFAEKDFNALKPGWESWLATHRSAEIEKAEQQRQSSLYLQSQASAYQQQMAQAEMMQIARLQLQLTAVNTGAVDMWEVYLYPAPGVMAYPTSVVMFASNSEIARQMALQSNPGYVAGPIRKISARRF
ncbi:MAG: hypothetical protein ABL921_26530 [Pirellula sp.]